MSETDSKRSAYTQLAIGVIAGFALGAAVVTFVIWHTNADRRQADERYLFVIGSKTGEDSWLQAALADAVNVANTAKGSLIDINEPGMRKLTAERLQIQAKPMPPDDFFSAGGIILIPMAKTQEGDLAVAGKIQFRRPPRRAEKPVPLPSSGLR